MLAPGDLRDTSDLPGFLTCIADTSPQNRSLETVVHSFENRHTLCRIGKTARTRKIYNGCRHLLMLFLRRRQSAGRMRHSFPQQIEVRADSTMVRGQFPFHHSGRTGPCRRDYPPYRQSPDGVVVMQSRPWWEQVTAQAVILLSPHAYRTGGHQSAANTFDNVKKRMKVRQYDLLSRMRSSRAAVHPQDHEGRTDLRRGRGMAPAFYCAGSLSKARCTKNV